MTQPYTPQLPFSYEPVMGRIVDAAGTLICMVYANHEAENARLIVQAVNAYEDLLAALESASCGRYKPCGDWLHDPNNSNCSLTIARAAIAKAQGET